MPHAAADGGRVGAEAGAPQHQAVHVAELVPEDGVDERVDEAGEVGEDGRHEVRPAGHGARPDHLEQLGDAERRHEDEEADDDDEQGNDRLPHAVVRGRGGGADGGGGVRRRHLHRPQDGHVAEDDDDGGQEEAEQAGDDDVRERVRPAPVDGAHRLPVVVLAPLERDGRDGERDALQPGGADGDVDAAVRHGAEVGERVVDGDVAVDADARERQHRHDDRAVVDGADERAPPRHDAVRVARRRHQRRRHDDARRRQVGDAQVGDEKVRRLLAQPVVPEDGEDDGRVAERRHADDEHEEDADDDDDREGAPLFAAVARRRVPHPLRARRSPPQTCNRPRLCASSPRRRHSVIPLVTSDVYSVTQADVFLHPSSSFD